MNLAFGRISKSQTLLKRSSSSVPNLISWRAAYADLTKNEPELLYDQYQQSRSPYIKLHLCNLDINWSTNWFSHTNQPLPQLNTHSHSSIDQLPISPIHSPCCKKLLYNLGNVEANLSSSNQLSSQNLVKCPSLIFHSLIFWNHLSTLSSSQTFLTSLHHKEAYLSTHLAQTLPPSILWINDLFP